MPAGSHAAPGAAPGGVSLPGAFGRVCTDLRSGIGKDRCARRFVLSGCGSAAMAACLSIEPRRAQEHGLPAPRAVCTRRHIPAGRFPLCAAPPGAGSRRHHADPSPGRGERREAGRRASRTGPGAGHAPIRFRIPTEEDRIEPVPVGDVATGGRFSGKGMAGDGDNGIGVGHRDGKGLAAPDRMRLKTRPPAPILSLDHGRLSQ